MQLTTSLEQALGRELPPTLAFDYPTVASLVAFLDTEGAAAAPEPAADPAGQRLPGIDPQPQREWAVQQPRLQPDAAASRLIAILATHLQLPGAGITSGDSAVGCDRYSDAPVATQCMLSHLGLQQAGIEHYWRHAIGCRLAVQRHQAHSFRCLKDRAAESCCHGSCLLLELHSLHTRTA